MLAYRVRLGLLMALAIILLVSCGGGDPQPAPRNVSVIPSVVLTLSTTWASMDQGATYQFVANVVGTSNTGVTWSVQEAEGGTISTSGLYTAPMKAGTYHIVATSQADVSRTATAVISVPMMAMSVSPSVAGVVPGGTRKFTASVSGTIDRRVTWTVQEGDAGGTVTTEGVYTAPAQQGQYHLIANATCDRTLSAMATILVGSSGLTDAGNMTRERFDHTATLLPNGKVLLAGGGSFTGEEYSETKTAELYDPVTGKFEATGEMDTARRWHTATLLMNGKVLIAGGGTDGGWDYYPVPSAEVYDPATGKFEQVGDLQTARLSHTATLLANGKVLIAGGYKADEYIPTAELFDPDTKTFTAAGMTVSARSEHTATLLPDGRVLLVGGLIWFDQSNAAEIYDPATGKFTATGDLRRSGHSASLLLDGRVLVAGGWTTSGSNSIPQNDAAVYDPITAKFSSVSTMTTDRFKHTATRLVDGRVLLVGGYVSWTDSIDNIFVELFDPNTRTFAVSGNMASPRVGHTATLLQDGRVLITGGAGESSAELFVVK